MNRPRVVDEGPRIIPGGNFGPGVHFTINPPNNEADISELKLRALFEKCTVSMLTEMLGRNGLTKSGLKNDLIDRVIRFVTRLESTY